MGLASALVGAAVKTGVSVATDLLTDAKMPTAHKDANSSSKQSDHKSQSQGHHSKVGNHTRRAIDDGGFLRQKYLFNSRLPYETSEGGGIASRNPAGYLNDGQGLLWEITVCIVLMIIVAGAVYLACEQCARKADCGDVEKTLLPLQQRDVKPDVNSVTEAVELERSNENGDGIGMRTGIWIAEAESCSLQPVGRLWSCGSYYGFE